jgi:signal transduction histidine kinase/ActR/RegA family two-component response regulator
VARRALEGASRADLVREAVMAVLESGQADRAGVWIESEQEVSWVAHKRFSGLVAEPAVAALPSEWSTLSVEAPLPVEVMSGLQGVEQELLPGAGKPLIGALTEMRRALWIPVETRGRLRGVVFAGQRSKTANVPWQAARSVAAELGLALELEDQRRRNDAHRASNDAVRRALETLDSGKPSSEALQEIVMECTREGQGGSAALAVFAAVGRAKPQRQDGESARRALDHDLEFLWRSGEQRWTGALSEEPLQSLWRSAIETRRVVGTELRQRLGQEELSRIVVIPLQACGEALGVFIGGIRERSSSLAALESMELRAALAADILLRERIEEAHRTGELRERALLAASQAAAVDVDEYGRVMGTGITETQNSGKTTLGSSTSSKEGEAAFSDLFAADCAATVGNWLQESQAHRTSDIFGEATLRTGQHVRLRLLPTSAYGKRTVLLERLDSTGQNNERSALTELRNVIEWLEEGVVLFGANHEIRAINSRFAQIMGLAPEELERIQNFGDLLDALSTRLSNGSSLGQRWPGLAGGTEGAAREELRIERPIARLVERVAHPILDESGALLGRVEIFRDLTAQRLFQSKLLQNGKLAELGQKLTAIAHELSNPLTSILGYAQRLLRRGEARNDFREARQIFQEAERASAILRQLLLSVRTSRPERRRVALNQLISRAADLNSHDLANDDVHFQLDLDPSLPLVKGDEGQLQQVLQNLIGNARQALASQGEGATIRLTTRRIPDQRVLLEVADNGPGIPANIQSRIFDPFFTTKPAGEGTGLGLSIVAGIVSEHGGQVRVKSSPGRGSVFSVELPATTALEIQRAKPGVGRDRSQEGSLAIAEPAAPGYSGVALSRWAGARVLVLEDEPTVARLIADVLEDEGLKVDTLLDSREALPRAARHDYAFVICDMKMPQLDGEEFYLTLLREGSPLCDRFLFVTGDVLSAHTRNFLERYELPYVAKPFRVEELTDKIRSVLERGKPIGTAGDPVKKNAASK